MRYHNNYHYSDIFVSKNNRHINIWKLVLIDTFTMECFGEKADTMYLQREDEKYCLLIPKLYLIKYFTRAEEGHLDYFPCNIIKGRRFRLFKKRKWIFSKRYKDYLKKHPPKHS